MNSKTFIAVSLCLVAFVSCAQSKYAIRKIDAFFSQRTPGNIRADREGNSLYNGPDTINTIYIESKGGYVQWVGAWINGVSYSVVTTEIKDSSMEVGLNSLTNKMISLQPAPGYKLWQLQLVKDITPSKPPASGKTGEIILKGRSGGKAIIQKIVRQIEVTLPASV